LEALDREFSGRIETIYSTQAALDAAIMEAAGSGALRHLIPR
jgi:hypothetical protein